VRLDSVYLDLIHEFPLRPLRDDNDLDRAISVIDSLLDRRELSAGDDDYIAILERLVEDYETEHVFLPDVSAMAVVRHLMDANELRQIDLLPVFGARSVASEVLSGKRKLTLTHIQRLSAFFKLPADVFIDAPADPTII